MPDTENGLTPARVEKRSALPLSLLGLIRSDLRRKALWNYESDRPAVLFKTLATDGTTAMILYRLMQWSRRRRLAPLEMIFNKLNVICCQCIIGRGAEFGPGLVLIHAMGVVINGQVRGGANVSIEQQVTIGAERRRSPVIGDGVFIGAGAKIVGAVTIGDGARIGANAVVVDDIPAHSTAVGIPARVVRQRTPQDLLNGAGETADPSVDSDAQDESHRLGRRLIWWVRYLTIVSFATLCLLEVCLRMFMPQVLCQDVPELWMKDDSIGWRRIVNARVTVNSGERSVEVCTDENGDRVSCTRDIGRNCSHRVLVVGDSFVEALSIPWDDTVWSRLETSEKLCVNVAGVGGYGLGQYLQAVKTRLKKDSGFDAVVLCLYVGNDFTHYAEQIFDFRAVQRRPFRFVPAGLSRDDLIDWFYPVNQWLETWSHTYVATRAAIRVVRDRGGVGIYGIPDTLYRSQFDDELAAETARGVRLIAEVAHRAREGGIPLVLTIIPFQSQVLDPDAKRLKRAYPKFADDLDMDLVQERFLPKLEHIEGLTIVDMLGGFRASASEKLWGRRDQHLSPEGHSLWFKLLRGSLRNAISGSAAKDQLESVSGTP